MKIVQILPELNEGGVERGVVELSRELVKRNIKSHVISHGGKLVPTIMTDGGVHHQCDVCSKNILTIPTRVHALKKILKEIQPDIIHVRSRVPAWLVRFANKQLNIKVVSTVHGFNSVSQYSKIMQDSDAVICVSNAIKQYIIEHYHTPNHKITVIPRGIDLELFNPDNVDETFMTNFKEHCHLEGAFVVSSVGRITHLKDYETFISSIALLKNEFNNIKALIVGGIRGDKQKYFESLQQQIVALQLEDIIQFTGSQQKIAEIYRLSDVVISTSKKPEAFGRSIAEAIALETPVVATNHGGVKDIIQEGVNGYLVPIQDPSALADAIKKASQLSFDGFQYISENFSLEQMVDKTINVYQSIVNNNELHS